MNDISRLRFLALWFGLALLAFGNRASAARYDGKLTLVVTDENTQELLPVRMQLVNGRGRPVRIRPAGAIKKHNYFVFAGEIVLELPKGAYRFELDAGPEYQTRQGHFTIERHAEDTTEVSLRRHVDMAEEGWWAGDLDLQHRAEDLPLLKTAAGVSYTPNLIAQNVQGKYEKKQKISQQQDADVFAALDYRRGGGLLMLGEREPLTELDLAKPTRQDGSLSTLRSTGDLDFVALSPYAWDLPLWIAADRLTAIQILHRQSWPNGKHPNEGWGKPRDKDIYPGRQGNGLYSEDIYHQLLNCGLRIPPAAGSGSGANLLPLGTNRVYVECGDSYSPDHWLSGLRAGRVVVTNGPLLRAAVEGYPPGHVFQLEEGSTREFRIALSLSFYQKAPVEYLEVIKNGRVDYTIRLSDLAKKKGKLPPLTFAESGWFVVRAVTSSTETYQYATTGPFYVEQAYQPRVSRTAVQYFLAWLEEAREQFRENEQVQAEIDEAQVFWNDLLGRANTD